MFGCSGPVQLIFLVGLVAAYVMYVRYVRARKTPGPAADQALGTFAVFVGVFAGLTSWVLYQQLAAYAANEGGGAEPAFDPNFVLVIGVGASLLLVLVGAYFALRGLSRSEVVRESTNTTGRKCPYCAEPIQAEAIVCRYCGRDLPATGPVKDPAS